MSRDLNDPVMAEKVREIALALRAENPTENTADRVAAKLGVVSKSRVELWFKVWTPLADPDKVDTTGLSIDQESTLLFIFGLPTMPEFGWTLWSPGSVHRSRWGNGEEWPRVYAASISRTLRRLEQRGLVERASETRRTMLVRLTPAGLQVAKRLTCQ